MFEPGNLLLCFQVKWRDAKFCHSVEIAVNMSLLVTKWYILEHSFLGNRDMSRNFASKGNLTNGMKVKNSPFVAKGSVFFLDVFDLSLESLFFSNNFFSYNESFIFIA